MYDVVWLPLELCSVSPSRKLRSLWERDLPSSSDTGVRSAAGKLFSSSRGRGPSISVVTDPVGRGGESAAPARRRDTLGGLESQHRRAGHHVLELVVPCIVPHDALRAPSQIQWLRPTELPGKSALSWSLISFPVFLITSVPLPCFPLPHPVPLLPLSSLPPPSHPQQVTPDPLGTKERLPPNPSLFPRCMAFSDSSPLHSMNRAFPRTHPGLATPGMSGQVAYTERKLGQPVSAQAPATPCGHQALNIIQAASFPQGLWGPSLDPLSPSEHSQASQSRPL